MSQTYYVDSPKIRVRSAPWWGEAIEMLIGSGSGAMQRIAEPLQYRELSPGHAPDAPTVRIERDEAQLLMDQLWDCGLRPTQGKGSAGQLTAVQAHLNDLREIVFQRSPHLKPR